MKDTASFEPIPTSDVIISQYENKLNGSIARKTVAATKEGKSPFFTKEEMDYLTKKAIDDSPYSEVKVITPAPSITLKKGNREINIKHAAELVQRMEELYPKGMPSDTASNINAQPFRQASFEHGLKDAIGETVPPRPPVPEPKQESKSVNKNAYELRSDILKFSIDSVDKMKTHIVLDEYIKDVLNTADKFYEFVENRNRRK